MRVLDAVVAFDAHDERFERARWHDAPGDTPPCVAEVRITAGPRPDWAAGGEACERLDGGGYLFRAQGGRLELAASGESALAEVWDPGTKWDIIFHLWRLGWRWLLHECQRRGALELHAASFLDGDGAWIVAGDSGAGKTTLCGRLDPEVLLNEEFALAAPTRAGGYEAWWFPHARAPTEPRPPRSPLRGIAYLTPRRDRTAAQRLSPPAALAWLSAHALGPLDASPERWLESVATMALNVPVMALDHHLGSPVAAVAAALRAATEVE